MTELAFLVDVDNTLIDNDAVKADLAARVTELLGPEHAALFWSTYEEIRREREVIDFPHTLERLGPLLPDARAFAHLAALVFSYPYEKSVYPGAREAVRHLRTLGPVAIVSDGDPVFQPAKIARAGFADLVDAIFITVHKDQELGRVMESLPASRHVVVDDKPAILADLKRSYGDRLYTLHVCQGHYAHGDEHSLEPAPDRTVESIGELARLRREDL
jgi:beta-phosphoglucomutase-like phosphatase (HAD superfamily)